MILKNKLYTKKQIERRANGLLRDYYGTDLKKVAPPIKVDEIMQLHLGLNVLWEDIFNDESMLAGLVPSRNMIVFNESLMRVFENNKGLENFTKAHEIGHWLLHVDHRHGDMVRDAADPYGKDGQFEVICRDDDADWDENNADMFASYLLMPKAVLKPIAKRYKLNWLGIYKLAEDFQVPPTALKYRLIELGFLRLEDDPEDQYAKETRFVF